MSFSRILSKTILVFVVCPCCRLRVSAFALWPYCPGCRARLPVPASRTVTATVWYLFAVAALMLVAVVGWAALH